MGIENPIPFLTEAAEAATAYLARKREHVMLVAEIRAKQEAKRAAYGAAAAISALFALLLFTAWITIELHEAGVASWIIAVLSLLTIGSLSAILTRIAARTRDLGQSPANTHAPIENPDRASEDRSAS